MPTSTPIANVSDMSVSLDGKAYKIQALSEDNFTVLFEGVPVGRIVYTFGAVNGVPEGGQVSEDSLYAIAEAWFAATPS